MKLILALVALVSAHVHATTNEELERRVNILADEIAQLKASQFKMSTGQQAYGLGQAASKVYFINQGISIGGYGELIYNNKAAKNEDGDATDREPTTEALRNIIYFGYKYNDKWILNTEIEIEHADEVYTEFMYVDYLASEKMNFRYGLGLIPMGLTNELHEPIYFNSVNRPEVEKYLIPTTWREVGIGAFGSVDQWTYKAFIFNGPDADAIANKPSDGIRAGRKKGGVGSNASTHAAVIRADYNFSSSSSLGGSIYRGQGSSDNAGNDYIDMDINIFEFHGLHKHRGFGAKFLYVAVDLANAQKWNEQAQASDYIPNKMDGYYLEFEYDIERSKGALLTPFVRYEAYDLTRETDKNTFGQRVKSRNRTNTILGVAYKPIDRLVFKADYQYKHRADDSGVNEFNLGLGFVY